MSLEIDLSGYRFAGRNLVMYPDLNAQGRLFGGHLMSWVDEAAAMVAMEIMGSPRVVTKKFSEVVFDAPGHLGDVLEIWCRSTREGRTSLTLECQVVVCRQPPARRRPICRCSVVYVSLDEAERPTPWRRAASSPDGRPSGPAAPPVEPGPGS